MEDHCICCGDVIPEGRMVCPDCEESVKHLTVRQLVSTLKTKKSEENKHE